MRLYVDIETDSLDPKRVWIIGIKDIDTGETQLFKEPDIDRTERSRLVQTLNSREVKLIVGHNFIKFDLARVLKRFFPEIHIDPTILCDTLVCSRVFNYSVESGHSLEAWGNRLKIKKPVVNDFSSGLTQEIIDRVTGDLDLGIAVFRFLETHIFSERWKKALELEHKMEFVTLDMESNGFFFNIEEAQKLRQEIDSTLEELDKTIKESFPPKAVLIKEITPRVTKNGTLNMTDFRWMNVMDLTPYSEGHTFSLIEFQEFNPASPKQIVERLNKAGWKPFNKTKGHIKLEMELKRCRDKEERAKLLERLEEYKEFGWSIDEENLSTLPEHTPEGARKLAERIVLASRRSVLDEWLRAYKPSTGRIHGRFNSIGSWTHRMSHQNPNQGNIPSDPDIKDKKNPSPVELWKLKYSKSLRALWGVPPKKRLIGVDADGIQLRVLAHYMDDKDFTDALVNGDKDKGTDAHSLNTIRLGMELSPTTRARAKTFIYAFLLGAGVDKVAYILHTNTKDAREKQNMFIESTPGLAHLKKVIIPEDGKRGYFEGLDGRLVRVPSEHHVLAGYLQNGEQLVMKLACLDWRCKLWDNKIDFKLVDFVHDEWQTEIDDDDEIAEFVIKTQAQSIVDAGITLGMKCPLAGQGSYYNDKPGGYNWAQTH